MTQRTQETQPEPQSQSQDGIDRRLLPWSHRLPVWARFLVDLLAGAVVGVIGSLAVFFAKHTFWPQGFAGAFDVPAALIALAALVVAGVPAGGGM